MLWYLLDALIRGRPSVAARQSAGHPSISPILTIIGGLPLRQNNHLQTTGVGPWFAQPVLSTRGST